MGGSKTSMVEGEGEKVKWLHGFGGEERECTGDKNRERIFNPVCMHVRFSEMLTFWNSLINHSLYTPNIPNCLGMLKEMEYLSEDTRNCNVGVQKIQHELPE